jgi:hypothetical protein
MDPFIGQLFFIFLLFVLGLDVLSCILVIKQYLELEKLIKKKGIRKSHERKKRGHNS